MSAWVIAVVVLCDRARRMARSRGKGSAAAEHASISTTANRADRFGKRHEGGNRSFISSPFLDIQVFVELLRYRAIAVGDHYQAEARPLSGRDQTLSKPRLGRDAQIVVPEWKSERTRELPRRALDRG